MRLLLGFSLLVLALAGCGLGAPFAALNSRPADLEYLERTFGPLHVGEPAREAPRESGGASAADQAPLPLRVPVEFERQRASSPRRGVVLHAWQVALEGRTALVTARVTQGGDGTVGVEAIELGPLEPGPLELVYLDSDGRRTLLASLVLPP